MELAKLRDQSQGIQVAQPVKVPEPEFASNAPNQFNRKMFKYLSDKEF